MRPQKKGTPQTTCSLVDYVMAKKRAKCPVCQLSAAIVTELEGARTKKITRTEQIEWLTARHGITLRLADFDCHYSGRHQQ